eukprot:5190004-Lingulodinium_polyedra.AAC.1
MPTGAGAGPPLSWPPFVVPLVSMWPFREPCSRRMFGRSTGLRHRSGASVGAPPTLAGLRPAAAASS